MAAVDLPCKRRNADGGAMTSDQDHADNRVNDQRVTFLANEAIFQPKTLATHFYLVENGRVLIVDIPRHQVKAVYRSGEIFGIAEVLAGGYWPYTALAGMNTVVRCFPKQCLMQSLKTLPDSHQGYLQSLAVSS